MPNIDRVGIYIYIYICTTMDRRTVTSHMTRYACITYDTDVTCRNMGFCPFCSISFGEEKNAMYIMLIISFLYKYLYMYIHEHLVKK